MFPLIHFFSPWYMITKRKQNAVNVDKWSNSTGTNLSNTILVYAHIMITIMNANILVITDRHMFVTTRALCRIKLLPVTHVLVGTWM